MIKNFVIAALTTAALFSQVVKQNQTFILTGRTFNPGLMVEATDRLEALTKIGVTVWTAEEWIEAEQRFMENSAPALVLDDNQTYALSVQEHCEWCPFVCSCSLIPCSGERPPYHPRKEPFALPSP